MNCNDVNCNDVNRNDYLRARWWRVRRNIFLCFFLRMRLRRFLISEPIARETLSARGLLPKRQDANVGRTCGARR